MSGYSYPYLPLEYRRRRCNYIFFTSTHPDQWADLLLGLNARRADIRHDIGCCLYGAERRQEGLTTGTPIFQGLQPASTLQVGLFLR